MSSVFVTGGSGFVGSRLIPALLRRGHTVAALDRTGRLGRRLPPDLPVGVISGDLLDPATYAGALGAAEVVIHLAAATGRARAADHVRVNAVGTETLLDACREAGVSRILFVSSIAAGFPDRRGYPYAEAKVRAEAAVRRAGLPFAILRPTMIFGAGSPVQQGLEKLALLPVVPVFGDGRTPVQPIDVEDVVRSVMHVIEQDLFAGETYEIGGSTVLTIEALLQEIRAAGGGKPGPVVHVPLGLLLPPLRVVERAGLSRLLPVTAGQLSSFRFAGTTAANPVQEAIAPGCRGVREMLAGSAPGQEDVEDRLDRECRVFASHLLGVEADAYVRRKYVEAHRALPGLSPADRFDALLIRTAGAHRLLAALADGYAAVFLPDSACRRKLVLLLAILETSAPAADAVDREVAGPPVWVMTRLVLRGLIAAARLAAGAVLFTPARLMLAGRPR